MEDYELKVEVAQSNLSKIQNWVTTKYGCAEGTENHETRVLERIQKLKIDEFLSPSLTEMIYEEHRKIQAKKNAIPEKDYFDFYWDGYRHTVDDILALKEMDIQNPRKFTVRYPVWNDHLLDSFIDVFRHFAEKNIFWRKFQLCEMSQHDILQAWMRARHEDEFSSVLSQEFVRPLFYVANALNLFSKMAILSCTAPLQQGDSETGFLLSGIALNNRLESIELGGLLVERSITLTESDHLALNRVLRTSSCLKELRFSNAVWNVNHPLLRQGLAENGTLTKLHLNFEDCTVEGESISNVVTALASHPSLQDLVIWSDERFGDYSPALQTLLCSSSTISTLTILPPCGRSNLNNGRFLNTENILNGLRENKSLRRLSTSKVLWGDLIFSRFFGVLFDCQSLERLDLEGMNITTEEVEPVISMERLSKPIELNLNATQIVNGNNFGAIEAVLRSHPEVRLRPHYYHKRVAHILHLNWCGRYLMDSPNVPLSLWPLVLERASGKPDLLYEFLKGPAFAGREGHI